MLIPQFLMMKNHSINLLGNLFIALLGGLAIAGCSAGGTVQTETHPTSECAAVQSLAPSEAGLQVTTLCIDIKDGATVRTTKRFEVELAITDAEQSKGLMFRTELADDKGMLFPYETPIPLSFWMKNTVISLDIIFINEDGSIANIARDTVPYSLDSVSSINPAIAVLELRAGLSKELGIKKGDIVRWK